MGKFSKMIIKLLDFFRKDDNNNGGVNYSKNYLTNQKIYDELVALFETKLKEMSVGERMIYPMSFNVILHESDYQMLSGALPLVFEEVVKQYGNIIRKYTEKFPNNLNPARNWTFQVSGSSDDIPLSDEEVVEVRKGSINIMEVGIFHEGASADTENIQNVRVTVKPRNSVVYKNLNINMDVYRNIFPLAEGLMQYPFDRTVLQNNNSNIAESSGAQNMHDSQSAAYKVDNSAVSSVNNQNNAVASLSYSKNGRSYYYTMKTNLIHISGTNDQRQDESIFHVDSVGIKDSHVQIRYMPNDQIFQIISYGPTRLNGKKMTESSGAENGWIPLPNNSSIFINDELSVKFSIIK